MEKYISKNALRKQKLLKVFKNISVDDEIASIDIQVNIMDDDENDGTFLSQIF